MSTQQASPQLSMTPIASAQPAVSQPAWSNGAPSGGWTPSAPAWQQPGPSQAAPQQAPAAWQQAFSQLVAPQMPMSPSPDWAASSPSTPSGPNPQAWAAPAGWGQPQWGQALSSAQQGNWGNSALASALPISSPQQTAGLSAADVQHLAAQAASQTIAQQQAAQQQAAQLHAAQQQAAQLQAAQQQAAQGRIGDAFLDNISDASLEVLQHFGSEAPLKLNTYACKIEDALLESLAHQQQQAQAIHHQHAYITEVQEVLAAASADRQAMLQILTDADTLSDYTRQFFGPDGPAPILTPGEQAQQALEQGLIGMDGNLMPPAGNPRMQFDGAAYDATAAAQAQAQGTAFQRPQMPMPSPSGQRIAGSENIWGQFSQLMDVRPENAWMVLSQASPEDLRRKVLFMEG